MVKALRLLMWELSALTRLRILLPLVAFTFFTLYLGGEYGGSLSFSREVPFSGLAGFIGRGSTGALNNIYMALAFFSVILASSSFAGEMDTGVIKCYLSMPVSRLEVFTAKVLANYILLFSAGFGAILYSEAIVAPEVFPYLLAASPFYILQPCLYLALETLFTFSVSLYFSIVSRRAWQSSLYSLITLYSFHVVGVIIPGLGWRTYFPPYTFAYGSFQLMNTIYFTIFSLALTAISAYIFVRRLEVT